VEITSGEVMEAYERLIPEFQKTDAGKGVGFTQSYGASATRAAPSRTAWPPTWSPWPSSPT
jgi:ABC-type sulfate transport system substrate-binding protein